MIGKKQLALYWQETKNVAQKGFFHLVTANGLIFLTGFASQLFVAGILLPEDIGRIKIMQAYLNLASIIGGLGFNISLLKLASERMDEGSRRKLFNLSLFVAILAFLVLYVILVVINCYGWISTDPVIRNLFPYYAIFLLPLTVQSMYLAYYQAKKKIRELSKLQLLVKVLSVATIIVLTFYKGLPGYVWAVPITGIISVIALEFKVGSALRKRFKLGLGLENFKRMWQLAAFALLANIVGIMLNSIDIYLVNYYAPDREAVGFYMFAITLISIFQLVPSSIQQVAMPFFSDKSAVFSQWFRVYKKYNKINHFLIPFMGVIGMAVIPIFVHYAFDGKYDESIVFFLLISVGWIIKSMNTMKGTALMGMGLFRLNFHSSLAALLISLPIAWWIIADYQIAGAPYARIIIGIISYVSTWIIFRTAINKIDEKTI